MGLEFNLDTDDISLPTVFDMEADEVVSEITRESEYEDHLLNLTDLLRQMYRRIEILEERLGI